MYSRTENEDGTYNSRCLYCFLTIARSVGSEAKLDRVEARHLCPEKALSQLMEKERAMLAARAADTQQPPHLRPN